MFLFFMSFSDPAGAPTVLLKTKGLSDGNFITAKFITVRQLTGSYHLTQSKHAVFSAA